MMQRLRDRMQDLRDRVSFPPVMWTLRNRMVSLLAVLGFCAVTAVLAAALTYATTGGGIPLEDHDALQAKATAIRAEADASIAESATLTARVAELEALKTPPEYVLEEDPQYIAAMKDLVTWHDSYNALKTTHYELQAEHTVALREQNTLAKTQVVIDAMPSGLWLVLSGWATGLPPNAGEAWITFFRQAGPYPPGSEPPPPPEDVVPPEEAGGPNEDTG